MATTSVHELRSQDAACSLIPVDGLTIGGQAFVDEAEGVASLEFTVEIDVAGEHFGHLGGDAIRNQCLIGGGEQGCSYRAAAQAQRSFELSDLLLARPLPLHLAQAQSGEVAGHLILGVGGVARHQFQQTPVGVDLGSYLLGGPTIEKPPGQFVGADELRSLGIHGPQAAEQALGRVAFARGLGAIEFQALLSQRFNLGMQIHIGLNAFGDQRAGQEGCIRRQGRNAEGRGRHAGAHQGCTHAQAAAARDQPLARGFNGQGHALGVLTVFKPVGEHRMGQAQSLESRRRRALMRLRKGRRLWSRLPFVTKWSVYRQGVLHPLG